MSQTPEKRIYLDYLGYRRHTRCWGGQWNGIGGLRLQLARRWKRPCQEIKAIIARKGEPEDPDARTSPMPRVPRARRLPHHRRSPSTSSAGRLDVESRRAGPVAA